MQGKNEIWLETTHGRRGKCKSQFKAVFNKVLISGLVLTTILSTGAMAAPAYAAEVSPGNNMTMEYGMTVEQSIQDIVNTVKFIQQNIKNGSIVNSTLEKLASQIYSLESAVKANGGEVSQDVKKLLNEVETFASNVDSPNASKVSIAVATVKASLGVDGATVNQSQSANNSGTSASQSTIKFTDVPDGQWYTNAIYDCARKGLVSGVGDNKFNPNATMSRSQFITVVVRYLYPDAVKNYDGPSTNWWDAYYNIAVEKGLITTEEFRNNDTISLGMTRQEMALIIARALGELGQTPDKLVYDSQIPDYNSIGTYYRNAVKVTYTAGIISGTDSSGTFSPTGTLTRAQACTVLMRITEPTSRTPSTPNQATQVSTEVAKWVMGETHYTQPKVGDIVVVNGYEVVLEMQYGVLGAGQQAPDGTYVNVYAGWTFESTGSVARDGRGGDLVNPDTGKTDDKTPFRTDPRTGQMFTQKQWGDIMENSYPTNFEGEYDGEVFRTFWSWNATEQSWDWIGWHK